MKKKQKYFKKFLVANWLFVVLLLTLSSSLLAQNHVIDSLHNVLKTEKEDTNKVNTLNCISDNLEDIDSYDSSIVYALNANKLAEKTGFKKGNAAALLNTGLAYCDEGKYPKALEYDLQSLDVYREMGNKKGMASILNDIGIVYWKQGNYPKALEYYLLALDLAQQVGNKKVIANNLNNIGIIYRNQANYQKALEYYLKALSIYQETGNKGGIASNIGNISIVYWNMGDYSKALEYSLKALTLWQEIGNKNGMALSLGNIGNIYCEQADYPKALEYDKKALAMAQQIGNKEGITRNQCNIGIIYTKQRSDKLAKVFFDSSLVLAQKTGRKEDEKDIYNGLAALDSATANYKQGLEDYKNYIVYRDSLVNEANTKKTVQEQMNFDFEQQQAKEKAEQDKKDAVAEQGRNKQKVIRNSFIVGFALMLALAFFIFRGYRQKQKANEIITLQKEEVENQKALVEQQKVIVEEKNKDILDSIAYAKRLQDAILPPISIIKQYLPESFVMYKPKDIVAGDFYWLEQVGDSILIAAADCTGHGVPGALVSVVCSNALNRTVKEFKITEPGKILDKVRELVLETFERSEDNVQDGMDISLCAITASPPSKGGITIQWAGANNSLWYILNGEMKELAPDKQPIGKYYNATAFNTHNLSLQKGDTMYLFTDGYADQFGGPKGKKFKYKQLQEKLIAISHKPLAEQEQELEKEFESWRGNLEQVDDLLIIGIRV